MEISEKDKEYLATINEAIQDFGLDNLSRLEYHHAQAALSLLIIDRLRKRPKKEIDDDRYWNEELVMEYKKAIKEKHAREHMVD